MIALYIAGWVLMAIITAGIWLHLDGDEFNGDEWVPVFASMAAWPFLLFGFVGYFILKRLSKLAVFVSGFLDSVTAEKDDDKEKTCKTCKHCRGDIFDRGYWCRKRMKDINLDDRCRHWKEKKHEREKEQ